MFKFLFTTRKEANDFLKDYGESFFELYQELNYIAVKKSVTGLWIKLEFGFQKTTEFNKNKRALRRKLKLPKNLKKAGHIVTFRTDIKFSEPITKIEKAEDNTTIHNIPVIVRPGNNIASQQINLGGTLGMFLKLKNDKNIYGLTNAHVIIGNATEMEETIYSPRFDNNSNATREEYELGSLVWGDNNKDFDAALFRITKEHRIGTGLNCDKSKIIRDIAIPRERERLWKCGFKTKTTSNTISSINCMFRDINNGIIYRNQMQIKKISRAGDSGSILYNRKQKGVGLLFAADSKTNGYSYASPLCKIFNRPFSQAMAFGSEENLINHLEFEQFINNKNL